MQLNEERVHRIGDLEADEHITFQRKSWQVQKFGRAAVALFVLAGIAGVFGGKGPLATTETHSGTTRIVHSRFLRAESPDQFALHLERIPADRDTVSVSISTSLVQDFDITTISPEPKSQSLGDDTLVYEFARDDGSHGPIVFRIEPISAGWKSFSISVLDQPPAQLDLLVFP